MTTVSIGRIESAGQWFLAAAKRRGITLSSLLVATRTGRFYDVVSRQWSAVGAGTAIYAPGPWGPAVNFASAAVTAGANALKGQTFSRIAVIRPNAFTVDRTISNSSTATSNGAQWRVTPSGELNLLKANVSDIGSSSGAGINANRVSVVGVTYDGTVASFYANGRRVGTASSAQTFTVNSAQLGSRLPAASDEPFAGMIFMHADVANVVIPRVTMEALTRELHKPTRRSRRNLWSFAAAGGFKAAWARNANTLIGGAVNAA